MKILLLGEFSSFHKNLKDGLIALNHDVTIASAGDGWKELTGDINLGSNRTGFKGNLEKIIKLFKYYNYFKDYDVVQFIKPCPFVRVLGINRLIVSKLIKNNKKVFLVGAGATDENSVIADFFETKFKYPQLYQEIKKNQPLLWSQTPKGRNYNDWLLKSINGYIPIMYEYAQGYRNISCSKLCSTVPIPINVDKIVYEKNIVGKKIIFFHGLIRESVKGTPLIRRAMKRLENNYPSEVICIIDGKMPLDKYLELLKKVNVVVDQTYFSSNAMNALYSLALGKVVLGGGEPESLKEFELKESPVIPIKPNVDDIYRELETLVKSRAKITEIGEESRKFVENNHDYKIIAQRYVELWTRPKVR